MRNHTIPPSAFGSSYVTRNDFFTRLSPSKNTIMHTAEPVATFIMRISISVIPSKETSMERCKEKIETKAAAKEMFRSVINLAEELRRAFIHFIVARVILEKA